MSALFSFSALTTVETSDFMQCSADRSAYDVIVSAKKKKKKKLYYGPLVKCDTPSDCAALQAEVNTIV